MGVTLRTRLRLALYAMCQSRAGQRPLFPSPPADDSAAPRGAAADTRESTADTRRDSTSGNNLRRR